MDDQFITDALNKTQRKNIDWERMSKDGQYLCDYVNGLSEESGIDASIILERMGLK